jgi:hypothetical protein
MITPSQRPSFAATLAATLAVTLIITAQGCSPAYVRDTKIAYSVEKQEIADTIERYRVALESRDAAALRSLASEGYYENASTTDDPSDDYDARGLDEVLGKIKRQVKAVKYNIKINAIDVLDNTAAVDVEYSGQYLFTYDERDRWSTYTDKNRITLRREEGGWRIVSGL